LEHFSILLLFHCHDVLFLATGKHGGFGVALAFHPPLSVNRGDTTANASPRIPTILPPFSSVSVAATRSTHFFIKGGF
jgi:hypothetical protein